MIIRIFENYGVWEGEKRYKYSVNNPTEGAMSSIEIYVELPDEINPFINMSGGIAFQADGCFPYEVRDALMGKNENPYLGFYDEHMDWRKIPLKRVTPKEDDE